MSEVSLIIKLKVFAFAWFKFNLNLFHDYLFFSKGVDFENYELMTSVLSIGSELETEAIRTVKVRDPQGEEESEEENDDDDENQVILLS